MEYDWYCFTLKVVDSGEIDMALVEITDEESKSKFTCIVNYERFKKKHDFVGQYSLDYDGLVELIFSNVSKKDYKLFKEEDNRISLNFSHKFMTFNKVVINVSLDFLKVVEAPEKKEDPEKEKISQEEKELMEKIKRNNKIKEELAAEEKLRILEEEFEKSELEIKLLQGKKTQTQKRKKKKENPQKN